MYYSTVIASAFLASLVAGHGAIIGATGDAGGEGSAIGVDPATPRDGTRRNPFQQDSTRFQGAQADACGETLGGGDNDLETGTAAMMANMNSDLLPQVTQGGEVQMTLHQVNGDGAGPYTCMIDSTGTGTQWENIQVTQQAPGRNGRNRDTAESDVPLTAAIPANQECTGTVAGQDNVCVVRCQNPARAGPFGGCVPVQMVQAGAAAGAANATEAAGAGAADAADADAAAAKTKRTLSRRTRIMGRSNIAAEDDVIDAAFAAELIADGEEVI